MNAVIDPAPYEMARSLHTELQRACRTVAEADARLARLLLQCWDSSAHRLLGFAKKSDYCESLGLSYEKARVLVGLAKRFAKLPELEKALEQGIGWTKLREVAKVAVPETVGAWLKMASRQTQKVLADAVRHTDVGELPPPEDEIRKPVRGRFVLEDMDTQFIELVERALRKARHESGLA